MTRKTETCFLEAKGVVKCDGSWGTARRGTLGRRQQAEDRRWLELETCTLQLAT
jgi:hypothetical protein